MSAVISQISLAGLAPVPKPIAHAVCVGKDVLELLAGSMYVDPLNIYREYIQNAADSIDEARDADLLFPDSPPGVQIWFNQLERSIRIRDNGMAIPAEECVARLVSIGASQKRGKKARGFRGVGRLSGLGYCQELIFRSRAEGESKVVEVRWNARALREKMRDPAYAGGLVDLVKDIVTETKLPTAGFPDRFFEVELRKVVRARNDILLNEDAVRSYIAQVAPVPFGDKFSYAREIDLKLHEYGLRPPIHIELMDGRGPIYHRVSDQIAINASIIDNVTDVEFIEILDSDGAVSAFGWVAHHAYFGSIPKKLGLGGIRLRVGNIQVGDESILAHVFKETRFCGWAIGDFHIISPKIVPNGRRDDFEQTAAFSHFLAEMTLQARKITSRIRERSAQRNQLRFVNQHCGAVEQWLKAASGRKVPRIVVGVLQEVVRERLASAEKESQKLKADSEQLKIALAQIELMTGRVNALSPQKRGGKANNQDDNSTLESSISTVIRTILSAAKTPDAGLDLTLQVVKALELEKA
jgi:molecular chaperone HtpG